MSGFFYGSGFASASTPWCWYTRVLPFVKPNLHRVSRIKPNLATKCRTKPQCGFVIFPAAVFARGCCTEWLYANPAHNFPQRACEAARRMASSHRSSFPAPAIVRCPSSKRAVRATAGVQFPSPPRDRATRKAFRPARMAHASRRCAYSATLKQITAPLEAAPLFHIQGEL